MHRLTCHFFDFRNEFTCILYLIKYEDRANGKIETAVILLQLAYCLSLNELMTNDFSTIASNTVRNRLEQLETLI